MSCKPLSLWDCSVNSLAVRTDLTPDQFNDVSSHLEAGDAYKVSGYRPHQSAGLIEWIHAQGGHLLLRPLCGDERARALCLPKGCAKLTDQPLDAFCHADWAQIDAIGNVFRFSELVKECKVVVDRVNIGKPPGLLPVKVTAPSRDQPPDDSTMPPHGRWSEEGCNRRADASRPVVNQTLNQRTKDAPLRRPCLTASHHVLRHSTCYYLSASALMTTSPRRLPRLSS